jgi:CRISPR/Cas system CMR subunit Cmr6 (Cas7 group RAMP superfamily)
MQHKQNKNKHNNATMNCNDRGVNYQQSTISEDNTNNKDNDYDYGKHKHRESTQKRRHASRQAATSDRSERQGFYDQSQFYKSFTMRTHKASCHHLSNHQMHVHPVSVHCTMWN